MLGGEALEYIGAEFSELLELAGAMDLSVVQWFKFYFGVKCCDNSGFPSLGRSTTQPIVR